MFSPVENRIVRSPVEAAGLVEKAITFLGDAVRVGLTTRSRAALVDAASELVRASRDTMSAAYALLGGLPPRPAKDKPDPTRAEQLAVAWGYLDRAVDDSLGSAIHAVEAAQNTLTGGYLETAVSLLNEARGKLTGFNRNALVESDPPHEAIPVIDKYGVPRRTIIVAHGDYHDAQHISWTCTHYGQDWMSDGFVPLLAHGYLTNREPLGRSLRIHAILNTYQLQVAALIAGISLYSPWDHLGPFSRALKSLHRLQTALDDTLDGIPEWLAAHGDQWDLVEFTSKTKAAHKRGSQRMRDRWRRSDKTAWLHNLFLDGRGETSN